MVADKVDKVAHDIAAAKQAQAELTERVSTLAAEGLEVKALSEALKGKLSVLELERQAAYTAAQVCDEKAKQRKNLVDRHWQWRSWHLDMTQQRNNLKIRENQASSQSMHMNHTFT